MGDEKHKECCEWKGRKNKKGYGVVLIGGKQFFVHRLAVALSGRNIPKGKVCDHICRNHACYNPKHIELITIAENVMRGVGVAPTRKLSKTCENGHPWNKENTWIRKHPKGIWRQCRKCNSIRMFNKRNKNGK